MSAYPGMRASDASPVSFFPEQDGGEPLVTWFQLVASDEPVDLLRPASECLAEARAAGEV